MPNWCFNSLEVTGPELACFRENVRSETSEFSFNSLMPCPEFEGIKEEELKKILSDTQISELIFAENGEVDWYTFCCNKWGTKWDAKDVDIIYDSNYIKYMFQTAWGPPEPWLIKISRMYDCKFEMVAYEYGCNFWCELIIDDGEILENRSMTIREKVEEEFLDTYDYDEVKRKFLCKLSEIEYDEDEDVENIDELREIVDELDCDYGCYILYDIFNDIRKEYYKYNKENNLDNVSDSE